LQTDGRSRRADGRCNSVNPRNCIAQRRKTEARACAHRGTARRVRDTRAPRNARRRRTGGGAAHRRRLAGDRPPDRSHLVDEKDDEQRYVNRDPCHGLPRPHPRGHLFARTSAPRTGSSARWASGNPALCNVNSPWRINFSRSPVSDHDLNLTPNPAITLTQPQPKTLTAT